MYVYFAYSSWYLEVFSIKTLNVTLENWTLGTNQRPFVEVRLRIESSNREPLRVNYITVSVQQGSETLREVTLSYPQGLPLVGSRAFTARLELPSYADPRCLSRGGCFFRVEVGVVSRFGIVPLQFTLSP